MAGYDTEWYRAQWKKNGREIYYKAVEGIPASDFFQRLRLLADIRLTESIRKATWALVFVGAVQVLIPIVALFRR
jgi:hypothetical protein